MKKALPINSVCQERQSRAQCFKWGILNGASDAVSENEE